MKANAKTIAIPAIGTGGLGYPRDKVAITMIQAVLDSFRALDSTVASGIMVKFVIHPTDNLTFKVCSSSYFYNYYS